MRFCSQCGSPRKVSDKFCGSCGTSFANKKPVDSLSTESALARTVLPPVAEVEIDNRDSAEEGLPIQTKDIISDPSAEPKEKLRASRTPIFAAIGIGVAALIVTGVISQGSAFDSQESSSRVSSQTSAESSCVGLACYASVSAVADGTRISISVIPYRDNPGTLTSVEASPTNSWGEPFGASGCEDFWNEMKKTTRGWELLCTSRLDVTTDDRPPVVSFRAKLSNDETVKITVPIQSRSDLNESVPDAEEQLRQSPTQVESRVPEEPYGGQCALVGPAALNVALVATGLGSANFDVESQAAREFVERKGYQSFEEWIAEVELLNPLLNLLDRTQLTQEESDVLESLTRALEPGEMTYALFEADADWYREFEANLISFLAACDG